MKKVLLGYEIGSGAPVEIPVAHLAVTGQTQQSGKTTTLEALIHRSGLRAIAFVTKRGEGTFAGARRIPAYFRERTDWEFVAALLEAMLREKKKFERPWIMRACRGTKTLAEVHANVQRLMAQAKGGFNQDMYMLLDEYFKKLIPQIERLPYSTSLQLEPGINAIDLTEYTAELQALVIRSVIEWVYEHERDTIVIIPEAWEFIPEGRGSPVKLAAEQLIRKGAGLRNYIWLDSQDLAGIAKVMLRAASVWILGVQREANEVKRTLANMTGAGLKKPKADDVMTLGRGEFFVAHGRELKRVYVQPAWIESADLAQAVARGQVDVSVVAKHAPPPPAIPTMPATVAGTAMSLLDGSRRLLVRQQNVLEQFDEALEDEVWKERAEQYEALLKRVANAAGMQDEFDRGEYESVISTVEINHQRLDDVAREMQVTRSGALSRARQLMKQATTAKTPAPSNGSGERPPFGPFADSKEVDSLYAMFRDRLAQEAPSLLRIAAERPEMEVTVQRKVVEADASTLRGRLAQMIAEHYFDEPKNGNTAFNELQRVGFRTAKPNVYRELDNLTTMGFLTKEGTQYKTVPGMKVNIREVRAA